MTELHEEIKKYFVKKFGIAAETIMKDVEHEWSKIDRMLKERDEVEKKFKERKNNYVFLAHLYSLWEKGE